MTDDDGDGEKVTVEVEMPADALESVEYDARHRRFSFTRQAQAYVGSDAIECDVSAPDEYVDDPPRQGINGEQAISYVVHELIRGGR